MSAIFCFLWWVLLGALLGWLASWLFGRGRQRIVETVRTEERLVDNPQHVSRIASLESELSELQRRPPTIVERIVDRPVEKIVDKLVDNPAHLARIRTLEADVAKVAGLEAEIARLRATPPITVEKIVEKPVDKLVDNPAHLARIRTLEADVGKIAGLEAEIARLRALPAKTVEKIAEKIVEKPVDRVVEKIVPDAAALAERDRRYAELKARHDALEADVVRLKRGPEIDLGAARAAGFKLKGADDLEIIEGIGPKIADLLRANGVTTFAQLAAMSPADVKAILDRGGSQFSVANPGTWPEQADLCARNRWAQLKTLQDELVAGVRVARPAGGGDDAVVKDLRAQLLLKDAELKRYREPKPIDMEAARAAGFSVRGHDDLEIIEGIGPKIADLLRADGVATFAHLSVKPIPEIRAILERAGPNFRLADPGTWPEQADLAARGHWRALALLQKSLDAGKR